jgi:hypothetical protein
MCHITLTTRAASAESATEGTAARRADKGVGRGAGLGVATAAPDGISLGSTTVGIRYPPMAMVIKTCPVLGLSSLLL